MEILNLSQIIWQAINFLLLYLIIAKFVVPPTKKFLAKREHEINSGIENAEKVKKQLSDAQKSKEKIVSQARVEANVLLEEMRKRADELSKKMQEEAKTAAHLEAEKIIDQAKIVLDQDRQKMNDEVLKLASSIAKHALSESITVDLQHDLLKKNLEQIKKNKIIAQG